MGDFAALGGLMCYGFKFADNQRSAAEIVDKILRGAKAGDIPIQQPTTCSGHGLFDPRRLEGQRA